MADINVGGQAIIEGVMLRAGKSLAMAVRLPDGRIAVRQEAVASLADRLPFLKWPGLRGILVFFESLVLGIKALEWSAGQALEAEAGPAPSGNRASDQWLLGLTLALGLGLGVALFGVVPFYAARFTANHWSAAAGSWGFNMINGLYKLGIFVLYLWVMSWIPDLRRVFMYHGAEHKSIAAWENRKSFGVAEAQMESRLHPRCSTAFLLMVIVVAIFIFALFLPKQLPLPARLAGELGLMLPIAGLTYEAQRLLARYQRRPWAHWLTQPGLLLQNLTTREPEAGQIEVALAALQAVLHLEEQRLGLKQAGEPAHVG